MIKPWKLPNTASLVCFLTEGYMDLRRTVLPPWLYSSFVGAVSPFALLFLYFCAPDAALYGGKWSLWICPDSSNIHFQATGLPMVFFHVAAVGYWMTGLFLSSKMSSEIAGGREYAAMTLLEYSVAMLLFLIPVLSAGIALTVPFGDFSGKVTVIFGEGTAIRLCACAFRKILPLSRFFSVVSFVLGALSFAIKPSRTAVLMSIVSASVFAIISGLIAWISA
jgi:hypothetical protein